MEIYNIWTLIIDIIDMWWNLHVTCKYLECITVFLQYWWYHINFKVRFQLTKIFMKNFNIYFSPYFYTYWVIVVKITSCLLKLYDVMSHMYLMCKTILKIRKSIKSYLIHVKLVKSNWFYKFIKFDFCN